MTDATKNAESEENYTDILSQWFDEEFSVNLIMQEGNCDECKKANEVTEYQKKLIDRQESEIEKFKRQLKSR